MNLNITPTSILLLIFCYFAILLVIAKLTSGQSSNATFFNANKSAKWYLVAFGMIGASLSGVTFISIPGLVGAEMLLPNKVGTPNVQFSYMQMVMGYLLGYVFIAFVLMPIYYKMNLTTIYGYLRTRFGNNAHKTGAAYFILSRIVGASFRLYLVALVLQKFVFDPWGVPFYVTALLTILLIWVYTFQGGIKTIIWTDTLQTACMIIAVIFTIYELSSQLGIHISDSFNTLAANDMGQWFYWDGGWQNPNSFFKQFIAGAFIAIVMTGMDQDMMQKNLACKNIQEAQKNMMSFSVVLFFVNIIFLVMGGLLALYAIQNQISIERTDELFPTIALTHLSSYAAVFFLIGLIAAAYSSADSALTSLTTSFCVDFLGMDEQSTDTNKRRIVHIGFSIVLFIVLVIYWSLNDDSVVNSLFRIAGYTYGPILGLFFLGIFSKKAINDKVVPFVCIAAPILTYIINANSASLLNGYTFGFELLLVNGLITILGLIISSSIGSKMR